MASQPALKIWIDLDNTPHVPFFSPIIRALETRGIAVVCTARNAFQVFDLAQAKALPVTRIGRHYGQRMAAKAFGLLYRALQLLPFARREKPGLAVSHGSRSQVLASNLLRIPTAELTDYEHYRMPFITRPQWLIVPEVIAACVAHLGCRRILQYPGIKEDVYAGALRPDPTILRDLQLSERDVVVTVRPPATEAHYHCAESELLFERAMARLCATPGVKTVLLPRNRRQQDWMTNRWPQWFGSGQVVIPSHAVDGINLLWHSDLAVSGGGTMNREAAVLGVPVYSIFRGRLGALDRSLARQGRLTLIESPEQVDRLIRLEKRERNSAVAPPRPETLNCIVALIEKLLVPA